jgi:hypothetical protein
MRAVANYSFEPALRAAACQAFDDRQCFEEIGKWTALLSITADHDADGPEAP